MAETFPRGAAFLTAEGGFAIAMVNKTGAPSVKGMVVTPGGANFGFVATGVSAYSAIGCVYNEGIPDGDTCLVVISGICDVLLEDATASTAGYWVKTSDIAGGRADATLASPPGGGIPELTEHSRELGHCLESVSAGVDKIARITLHLN